MSAVLPHGVSRHEWTRYVQDAPLRCIAVSPEGSLIAVAEEGGPSEGCVQVRSAATGEVLFTTAPSAPVQALAFAPKAPYVACADLEGVVSLWSTQTGACAGSCRWHVSAVHALAWSPDGHMIASVGGDRIVQIWDATRGECAYRSSAHAHEVSGLAFSPDGACLVSGGSEVVLHRLGHAGVAHEIAFVPRSTYGVASEVDFFPGSRSLVLAGDFSHVEVWDCDTLSLQKRYHHPALSMHTVVALACRPGVISGMLVLAQLGAGSRRGGERQLWLLGSAQEVRRPLLDTVSGLSAVAWLDRDTMVAGTEGGLLLVRRISGLDG
jgi:WD40 repeat protein